MNRRDFSRRALCSAGLLAATDPHSARAALAARAQTTPAEVPMPALRTLLRAHSAIVPEA